MNVFFDEYVHSKTSLKQLVGQYEKALRNKVEKEFQAHIKSIDNVFFKTSTSTGGGEDCDGCGWDRWPEVETSEATVDKHLFRRWRWLYDFGSTKKGSKDKQSEVDFTVVIR